LYDGKLSRTVLNGKMGYKAPDLRAFKISLVNPSLEAGKRIKNMLDNKIKTIKNNRKTEHLAFYTGVKI